MNTVTASRDVAGPAYLLIVPDLAVAVAVALAESSTCVLLVLQKENTG